MAHLVQNKTIFAHFGAALVSEKNDALRKTGFQKVVG
jgi:hypothetical protein